MSFQDTDLFLVQNNNSTEKITFAQLKEGTVLNDTDQLLINNGTKTNKVAWSELKAEIGPSETAPTVGSVSLVESSPNADPRFTSQEFVASVSMTADGVPQSTKKIDAYVEGEITQDVQFDEPLESTSFGPDTPGQLWYLKTSSVGGQPVSDIAKAFDGQTNTYARQSYTGNSNNIVWNIEELGWTLPAPAGSGKPRISWFEVSGVNTNIVTITYTDNTTTVYNTLGSNSWVNIEIEQKPLKTIKVTGNPVNTTVVWAAIKLNDTLIKDGDPFNPNMPRLNFADDTNLASLAAGDTVQQAAATAETWSDNLSTPGSGNDGNNDRAFDGDEDTFFRIGGTNAATYFEWLIGQNIKGSLFKVKVSAPANTSYQLFFMDSNNQNGYSAPVTVDANGFIEYDTSLVDTTDDVSGMRLQINESGKTNALHAVYINNQIVIDDQPFSLVSGTVSSTAGTTVTLSSSTGTWTDGVNVTGPEKTITTDNTKKYLDFDENGDVSDLLDAPQSPAYTTDNTSPSLTLKFPDKFPSGNAPDDELGDGTKLVVEVTATNTAGSDGPKTAEVQPEGDSGPALAGMTTYYDGNNTTNKLTTGIDLVNNDGMVWIKHRNGTNRNYVFDTLRGRSSSLITDNNAEPDIRDYGANTDLISFDEDGVTLGAVGYRNINNPSPATFVGWTFEKAEGYFDVIKMTKTNGTDTVQHSLGQKPGMIIGKNLSAGTAWLVYHSSAGHTKYGVLSDSGAFATDGGNTIWVDEPTDTEFKVGTGMATSGEHVFYVFAQDTPGVIKSGSYVGNVGNAQQVNLGFKPQWLLIKGVNYPPPGQASWTLVDKNGNGFVPSENYAENPSVTSHITLNNTGFEVTGSNNAATNSTGVQYAYVAIAAPTTRSLTQEEFNLQAAKFGTYNNRRDVHQGEQAMAQREALMKELQAAGVDPPAINKLLGGTSS